MIYKKYKKQVTAERRGNPDLWEKLTTFNKNFLKGKTTQTGKLYDHRIKNFQKFMTTHLQYKSFIDRKTLAYILFNNGHEFTALAVGDFREHLIDRGTCGATVNNYLVAIRSYIREANDRGLIDWVLVNRRVNFVNIRSKRKTKGPNREEIKMLWAYLKNKKGYKGYRDRVIYRLVMDLGLRRNEVSSIKIKDIDLKAGTIKIDEKYYYDKNTLEMSEKLKFYIKELLDVTDGRKTSLIYQDNQKKPVTEQNVYSIIKQWQKDLGNKFNIRPHGMRHSSVTAAIMHAKANNMVAADVMQHSRHKNIETLLRYYDQHEDYQKKFSDSASHWED